MSDCEHEGSEAMYSFEKTLWKLYFWEDSLTDFWKKLECWKAERNGKPMPVVFQVYLGKQKIEPYQALEIWNQKSCAVYAWKE